MTRLILAILLTSCAAVPARPCSAVQTQSDVGLIVGSTGVIVGTVAAVDPGSVRDDRSARHIRTAVVLTAAAVALAGIVTTHDAAQDARQCTEAPYQ